MKIKILIIEHNSKDVELTELELKKGGINFVTEIVQTKKDYINAIVNFKPDIILCNYTSPSFDGLTALKIREQFDPQTPFIFISETIGEENAVALIKCGATDFVLKERLGTLACKINCALDEAATIKSKAEQKKSEEKKTQEILHNDAKFRAFFENSMDGMFLTNTDGRILIANRAACEIFQMTDREIIEKGRMGLVDSSDPRLKLLVEERQRSGQVKGELTLVRKDGSTFPGEITSVVFEDTNGEQRTSMTVRDITQTNEIEKKLAQSTHNLQMALNNVNKILDSSMDIICSINDEGEFVAVNAASENVWGYKPEELLGKNYRDFLNPDDTEKTVKVVSAIKSGTPVTIFENRYIHKNGHIVPVIWSSRWDEEDKLFYNTAKDATEKKNLEKASAIERQWFQDLFSQAPSCMAVVKGTNHVYEMANPLYLQLIDKKDIIGKTAKEVLPELESQGFFEVLDTVYQTGETFFANEMLVKFDFHGTGELVDMYLNFIFQAHRSINGNIDGIFVFANDLTEQMLSRKKIEESEKKYRFLFDNNPLPMWIIDESNFKFLDVNEMAILRYGYSPDEFLAMKAVDIIPEADRERFVQLNNFPEINKTDHSNGIWNHKKKDGTIIPVEITAQKIIFEGSNAQFILSNDITERKKAELKLEMRNKEIRDYKFAMDESSIVGITNQKGIIIYANDNFCKISKYSREELIGQHNQIVSSGYHSNAFNQNKLETVASGKTWKGEIKNKAKDGTFYWVDTTIIPFLDEHGKPYQYFTTRYDITERKKADLILEKQNIELAIQYEERKNRAADLIITNNELLKTNSELDRFVYSVSHDLRSPLTSILGVLSFIEEESEEPDTLEHAKMIRNSINRLDDFIKNILNYSRNNRAGLEVEKISVNETALAILKSLQSMKEAKEIHYEIDIKEQQPFFTDRQRFNTILENLISNSIKYHTNEETGRYVKILGYSDHERLQITIADNGIGIAPEHHQKIFDMFFRLSGKKDGSGIGLYIVKDTIEMLHGSVEIQSEKGVGTTFTITLKNLKP